MTRASLLPVVLVAAALLPALLPAGGCQPAPDPTADEVLTLTVCPPQTPCEKFADGASQVTLLGCIAKGVRSPRRDLMAEFRIADGAFVDPAPIVTNPKIARVALTNDCAIARFRTPFDPQLLRVQFQLLTSTAEENPPASSYLAYARAENVAIEPAHIAFITFAPVNEFGSGTTTVDVDTFVRTIVGNPSNGTHLRLTVTPVAARVTPDQTTLGSASTSFRATLVPGTASAITITAVATPPRSPTGAAASAVSSSITLVRSAPSAAPSE